MNKKYWELYYQKLNIDQKPSFFSEFIYDSFCENVHSLIELGCGNGRDAVFFANKNIEVLAIDQCEKEMNFLADKYCYLKNIKFQIGDFTNLSDNQKYDIVYSRFTLHAITKIEETRTLQWACRNLNVNGKLCIEARGLKNEIFGKGQPVHGEIHAYIYNDHYRRFIDFEDLHKELISLGMSIEYAQESKGFAPYLEEDQIFIRMVASRRK
ncbi:MAG TPA: class I SAM-dependent methyltransferase [Prolixibacteraceae bacterium]|nr:class I SAM-dependent methyltransferase [Prolixibacteraceae bacterium]